MENLEFNYMLLGRLKSDIDFYLHHGGRKEKDLYYKDTNKHLKEMWKIWDSFTEEQKPEWLTYQDLKEYENIINNTQYTIFVYRVYKLDNKDMKKNDLFYKYRAEILDCRTHKIIDKALRDDEIEKYYNHVDKFMYI